MKPYFVRNKKTRIQKYYNCVIYNYELWIVICLHSKKSDNDFFVVKIVTFELACTLCEFFAWRAFDKFEWLLKAKSPFRRHCVQSLCTLYCTVHLLNVSAWFFLHLALIYFDTVCCSTAILPFYICRQSRSRYTV